MSRPNPYDTFNEPTLNRIYNNFGLAVLSTPIHIPDADLGIGHAEFLAPVPLLVAYDPIIQQPVATGINTIEDTYVKTVTKPIDASGFPQVAYYGEPMGGF